MLSKKIRGMVQLFVFFSLRLLCAQDPAAGRGAMRGAYLGATLGIIAFMIGQLMG